MYTLQDDEKYTLEIPFGFITSAVKIENGRQDLIDALLEAVKNDVLPSCIENIEDNFNIPFTDADKQIHLSFCQDCFEEVLSGSSWFAPYLNSSSIDGKFMRGVGIVLKYSVDNELYLTSEVIVNEVSVNKETQEKYILKVLDIYSLDSYNPFEKH